MTDLDSSCYEQHHNPAGNSAAGRYTYNGETTLGLIYQFYRSHQIVEEVINMRPTDDNEVESSLKERNAALLFSNELTALYTLLAILFAASLAYIVVKAVIHSRRSGFFSSATKSETFPINGKGVVNAA
ncbi:hypothetical protein Q1695_000840 [Nippostrongylus brasiliensis]|nr:hypothetical protein Q1695_000840 [Nippostrongylus brasiliensis]